MTTQITTINVEQSRARHDKSEVALIEFRIWKLGQAINAGPLDAEAWARITLRRRLVQHSGSWRAGAWARRSFACYAGGWQP